MRSVLGADYKSDRYPHPDHHATVIATLPTVCRRGRGSPWFEPASKAESASAAPSRGWVAIPGPLSAQGADVMDAALVVERRHRFGPHDLAARGADLGKRHVSVDHAKRRPDHVAAV